METRSVVTIPNSINMSNMAAVKFADGRTEVSIPYSVPRSSGSCGFSIPNWCLKLTRLVRPSFFAFCHHLRLYNVILIFVWTPDPVSLERKWYFKTKTSSNFECADPFSGCERTNEPIGPPLSWRSGSGKHWDFHSKSNTCQLAKTIPMRSSQWWSIFCGLVFKLGSSMFKLG